VQQNLDLESDEGVVDSLANYAQDEREIWLELREARTDVDNRLNELIDRLRDIDDSRLNDGKTPLDLGNKDLNGNSVPLGAHADAYVPWKAAGVDRLLMKLDLGSWNARDDNAGEFHLDIRLAD
jgi:hypothetical protein